MHEDHHKIHPNSTIVVLSNVSLSAAASTTVNNIVGNGGGGGGIGVLSENIITNTNSQIDSILADSMKLNLDSTHSPHTTTQYFFSTATPIVTTSNINHQLQSNNNTILIEDTNADIIVCNGDDGTLTVTSGEQQTLR